MPESPVPQDAGPDPAQMPENPADTVFTPPSGSAPIPGSTAPIHTPPEQVPPAVVPASGNDMPSVTAEALWQASPDTPYGSPAPTTPYAHSPAGPPPADYAPGQVPPANYGAPQPGQPQTPYGQPGPQPSPPYGQPGGQAQYPYGQAYGQPYGQGGYAAPGYPAPSSTNTPAIVGVVLGGMGLLIGFIPFVGFAGVLLGIAGLVLGIVGLRKAQASAAGKGLSITSIVVSAIALVVSLAVGLLVILGVQSFVDEYESGGSSILDIGTSTYANPDTASFDETLTYDDGLEVTVTAPTPYTPTNSAGRDEGKPVAFQITVTNNTDADFQGWSLSTDVTSAGETATQLFDVDLVGSIGTLAPGESKTVKVGYAVADPSDVVVYVAPDDMFYAMVTFE